MHIFCLFYLNEKQISSSEEEELNEKAKKKGGQGIKIFLYEQTGSRKAR